MRVVELVNSLTIGGAERMATDLAVGLQARGHQASVACLRGGGPLAEVLQQSHVEICSLEKGEGFSIRALRSFANFLKDRKVDVVHTHNPLTHHYGVLAGRLAKVPVVVNTFHGPGNLTGFGKTQLIFEASCLFSDRVVACCQSVQQHLQRITRVARRKLTMIPNGIELRRFSSIRAARHDGKLVFGAVGRLVPVKDHTSLLEAFASLARTQQMCRLEILGEGPEGTGLREKAEALGIANRVVFRGASLDVVSFLAGLDVFVLCSLSEGLPLTLIEAMAAALPVVGTSVGEIPNLVKASNCGWVCSPGNPTELATALLEAERANDRYPRGIRAREYVMSRHSIHLMVESYQTLFEQLLRSKHVRNAPAA
jgi:glycosyltransferase involved in cell wall biosynthesis